MHSDVITVPKDRIKVFIGKKGETRKKLEEALNIKLEIDVDKQEVKFYFENPEDYLKIKNVLLAIARGFTPDEALELISDENTLYIIDLKDWYGKNKKTMHRYKGRVIGEHGSSRKKIEEYTNTKIVVYGKTIGIIGKHEDVMLAKEAIEMLLSGSKHSTVYNFLERKISERNLRFS
ncbi:MAG: RNA-processing protein [Candidatus Nanohaloarchaeota archaeon]|nr:RNA-processing protein [Candidatus Nanohaloarchaeota archaeon]